MSASEVMDMRNPGEAFCSDCPDHEGCMTGYPCSLVKRVHNRAMTAPEDCTAFALDNVCQASNPCPVHGCDDTDDGSTSQGCYCDPERRASDD